MSWSRRALRHFSDVASDSSTENFPYRESLRAHVTFQPWKLFWTHEQASSGAFSVTWTDSEYHRHTFRVRKRQNMPRQKKNVLVSSLARHTLSRLNDARWKLWFQRFQAETQFEFEAEFIRYTFRSLKRYWKKNSKIYYVKINLDFENQLSSTTSDSQLMTGKVFLHEPDYLEKIGFGAVTIAEIFRSEIFYDSVHWQGKPS